MSLVLHGLEEDFNSLAIRAAAKIAQTPDFVFKSVKGSVGKAISPRGTLPVLHMDGDVLYGSNSISRLVCGKGPNGSALLGADEMQSAQVAQWMEYCRSSIDIKAATVTFPLLGLALSKITKVGLDVKGVAADTAAELISLLEEGVEKHLATKTFLVGKSLTLADITLSAALVHVFALVIDPATRSSRLVNTTRWFKTCYAQCSFESLLGAPLKLCETAPTFGGGKASVGGSGQRSGGEVTHISGGSAATAEDTKFTQLFQRKRTRIKDILYAPCRGKSLIGPVIQVCGWARTVRFQQKNTLAFVDLSDGSCFDSLQVVAARAETTGFADVEKAGGIGSSYRVTGVLVESPKAGQMVELKAAEIEVLGTVDPNAYPLKKTKHAHSKEFLRENAHLRPRSNLIGAVARVRNACAFATHRFFQSRGFLYIHTPILTASDCEGAGEMFQVTTALKAGDVKAKLPTITEAKKKTLSKQGKEVEVGDVDYTEDFFGKPAFLTVSGQLNVETYACAMSDVYTFGPTFRAENSHTARHLAEFWMIEPELCFATIEDDMNLAEDYLKYCTQYVLDHCKDDLAFFEKRVEPGLTDRLKNVVGERFERLTYTKAIEILNKPENLAAGNFEEEPNWGIDLGSEHERFLTEKIYKKPVIITDYPFSFKAFYMLRNAPDEQGRETVQAMDILVPKIGEIIGGSAREYRLEVLEEAMRVKDVDGSHLEWYKDLRRYGTVPHAGFGLGFERLIMYVTGIDNIRDVIPFPRTPGQCSY